MEAANNEPNSGCIGFCVDPFTLPCVNLDDKTDLPSKPGLYFVIDGDTLLYIGRSKDLNRRWKSHHRYKQIKAMSRFPQIAFLDCDDESLLWTEREVIQRFAPLLNDTKVMEEEPVPMRLNEEQKRRLLENLSNPETPKKTGRMDRLDSMTLEELRQYAVKVQVEIQRRYDARFTSLAQELTEITRGDPHEIKRFVELVSSFLSSESL